MAEWIGLQPRIRDVLRLTVDEVATLTAAPRSRSSSGVDRLDSLGDLPGVRTTVDDSVCSCWRRVDRGLPEEGAIMDGEEAFGDDGSTSLPYPPGLHCWTHRRLLT